MKPEILIVDDAAAVAHAAAADFARHCRRSVAEHSACSVALAGGSTPAGMYALLATNAALRDAVPWEHLHFFWGDERHVPPDHPDSNYRMAHQAMLSRVPVAENRVHRIAGENPDAQRAAEDYEQTLRAYFALPAGVFPRLDLVLLGLGSDGHTASLFPATPALAEGERLVVANPVARLHADRITLTVPVLNHAARVVFVVSGRDKAAALQAVLEGAHLPERYPAQLIAPVSGSLAWIVDRDAAHLLGEAERCLT